MSEPPIVLADRYELRERLGAGASGAVYRAFDRTLGRELAVKWMLEPPTADTARRFRREATLAAAFHHPDVIEVFDIGEHDGKPFLAMELVSSPSLASALVELVDPPTIGGAIAIAKHVGSLLAAAHSAGVVHRDLKPANIFVEGGIAHPTRCRLTDFGLAFMIEPDQATLGRFTIEGILLGTPLYMAPEQAEGRAVGPPVDIYALACIVHELIAGRPPFVGNVARVLAGHAYLPPIALRELDPEVPSELEQLVLAMLAKDPAARPNASDVVARLTSLADATSRKRSTTLQPRLARAIVSPGPGARAATELPAIRVDGAADLATALAARGITIDDAASLVLTADHSPPTRGQRCVWIHPAPSPTDVASAIRSGAAAVIRWPGPIESVLAHLHRVR